MIALCSTGNDESDRSIDGELRLAVGRVAGDDLATSQADRIARPGFIPAAMFIGTTSRGSGGYLWCEHARAGRRVHRRQRLFDVPATGRNDYRLAAMPSGRVRVTLGGCDVALPDHRRQSPIPRRRPSAPPAGGHRRSSGVGANSDDAIRLADQLRPDVTLIDIDSARRTASLSPDDWPNIDGRAGRETDPDLDPRRGRVRRPHRGQPRHRLRAEVGLSAQAIYALTDADREQADRRHDSVTGHAAYAAREGTMPHATGEERTSGSTAAERQRSPSRAACPRRPRGRRCAAPGGLAGLLERSGFEVVGQAGDGAGLLELVHEHRPDLVDRRYPHAPDAHDRGARGREADPRGDARDRASSSSQRTWRWRRRRSSWRAASGIGYLLKSRVTDVDEFIDTLGRILKGAAVVDPALVKELVAARRVHDPLDELSTREREVLALMAEGRSNAGIARQIWVTEGTVEKHVRSILMKLDLSETVGRPPPRARGPHVPRRALTSLGRTLPAGR